MASNIIRIDVLDCYIANDRLIFIVKKGQLGAAIGSKAKNLEKLRRLFKKNIKFVEFDDDDRPGIVHRLDKQTSGLLIVARNMQAQAGLSGLFV